MLRSMSEDPRPAWAALAFLPQQIPRPSPKIIHYRGRKLSGVSSIMCSYSRINDPYFCGNAETLKNTMIEAMAGQWTGRSPSSILRSSGGIFWTRGGCHGS